MAEHLMLHEGTVLRHRDGNYVVLSHRKDDDSGWWLVDHGGLADSALSGGDWFYVADSIKTLAANYERTVLALIAAQNPGIDIEAVAADRNKTAREVLTGNGPTDQDPGRWE